MASTDDNWAIVGKKSNGVIIQWRGGDIRVKPELDGLGALGDLGWYCIRGILWAVDYELPESVVALRRPVTNAAGVQPAEPSI